MLRFASFPSKILILKAEKPKFHRFKTITQSFAVKCLSYAENVQMERITIVHNGFSGRPTSFRYNSSNIRMQLFHKARFGWSYSWYGCDFVNSFLGWALNCTFWRTHTHTHTNGNAQTHIQMLLRKFQRKSQCKRALSDWLTMALASVEIHYFHFVNGLFQCNSLQVCKYLLESLNKPFLKFFCCFWLSLLNICDVIFSREVVTLLWSVWDNHLILLSLHFIEIEFLFRRWCKVSNSTVHRTRPHHRPVYTSQKVNWCWNALIHFKTQFENLSSDVIYSKISAYQGVRNAIKLRQKVSKFE